MDEWIEERRRGKEKSPEHHHALAPKHVRERAGRQLEEDTGDGRGGDNHADEFWQSSEIGGEDAPLVGARGFLGFRPLLFGMEREPAAPAGSTFFTFQDIAEYAGPLGGSRPRHHVRGKRSTVLSHECSIFVRGRAAPARDSRQDAPRPAPHMKGRKCKWPNLSQCRS